MTSPDSTFTIEIYKQRNRSKTASQSRHRLRWRIRGANNEKMGNGGAAYINLGDLVDALLKLWPTSQNQNRHITVKYSGQLVPLAEARSLVQAPAPPAA